MFSNMGIGTKINVLGYCFDPFYIDLKIFYKVFQIKKAYANIPKRTNKDPQ